MSESAKKKVGELNSFYGKHHTEETKRRISEHRSKKIVMLDNNKTILKEFNSIKEAAIYIIANKEEFICVKSNRVDTISKRIDVVCHQGYGTAYGYS